MKNKKELPSWKETLQLNLRAYRLIFKRWPKMMFSRFLGTAWSALTPYVGIKLSAEIINELSGERDKGVLMQLVLITLGSAALISLISAFITKYKNVECASLYYQVEHLFCEKMMDMDYIDAENMEVHALKEKIRENENGGGWGLYRVYGQIEAILSAFLSLFGGIALTISLFTTPVPKEAGAYTILNHPIFLLLLIGVMLLITYAAPMLVTKAGSYSALNADMHNLGNRLFSFFGLLGYRQEFATDVRMYRQDIICEKYNTDKEGAFSSKGYFAKLARWPVGMYQAASAAVSVVFTGIVYLFVCLKALAGAFGIGSVTQYVASINRLSGNVSSLIGNFGKMRNNAAFLRLVFEFLDIPNKMYQGSLTVEKRSDREYEVEFRDVSFRYPGSETYALRHVNMKFPVGERLAVVGENGSGKTTFIKLICRLYDPTEGEILLNGINIRKYNYKEYMSIFSVVFQDFNLLAYRLGENVAAASEYDRKRAEDCLNKAGFSDRLEELPNGLDTYLYKALDKEGVDISGGEAQKIAIARTIYQDASFLILDEPTASLDPIAEAQIYANFNTIVEDRTAIYISHRLSSCRFCDRIVVFEKGTVVQMGTHEELVEAEGGKYHQLWHAQAQYYTGA